MQKSDLVAQILAHVESEFKAASHAALESAEDATDEESRAENKYDTRALETSYVASAQAGYAKDLKAAIQAYRNLSLNAVPKDVVAIGSLVTTLGPNGREVFFIGPARGGLEIETDSGPVTVLTPKSPLGAKLLGKGLGNDAGERRILRLD